MSNANKPKLRPETAAKLRAACIAFGVELGARAPAAAPPSQETTLQRIRAAAADAEDLL